MTLWRAGAVQRLWLVIRREEGEREREVVTIKAMREKGVGWGVKYNINAHNIFSCCQGFKLRVSDLLTLDSPPKVLCCLKQWNDGGKVVLTEREQVVVRGVSQLASWPATAATVLSIVVTLQL